VRFVWLLLHALKSCACAEEQLRTKTVYRGVKGALCGKQYSAEKEIVWYQISSCSPDLSVQTTFLGETGPRVLFSIQLTCGRARDISQFSLHPDEKEIVLPPNSRFVVTGVLPQGDLTLVNMTELSPLDPILEFGFPMKQVRYLLPISLLIWS
jgi:hypothetical protein